MSEPMPKDIVKRMRQIAAVPPGSSINAFPEWFREEYKKDDMKVWNALMTEAANELEQMQQLAGRYLRRLAGD